MRRNRIGRGSRPEEFGKSEGVNIEEAHAATAATMLGYDQLVGGSEVAMAPLFLRV
jgi:hypothetical protein